MSKCKPPKISRPKNPKHGYCRISFKPDLAVFSMERLNDEFVSLLHRRAHDAAACTRPSVRVSFNGKNLPSKGGFESYCELFIGPKKEAPRVFFRPNERWEVCVAASADGFQAISFVNGVHTALGGTHVEHVVAPLTRRVAETLQGKVKGATIRPAHVREKLMLFVNATLVNPTFSSQTKEMCTLKVSLFGNTCDVPDEVVGKVVSKLGIAEAIVAKAREREAKTLSRTDGNKTGVIRGIPKLEDANKAGGRRSSECTLLVVEGDSARAFAMAGLSVVGRDLYGVFALRGKILNCRDAPIKAIAENKEIANLKQILGLREGHKYKSLSELRYGRVMLLTDADCDGTHIRARFLNFVEFGWPELIELGFAWHLRTHVVKAFKNSQTRAFFTERQYREWAQTSEARGTWRIKFLKGLGTSTAKDAKDIFSNMSKVTYTTDPGAAAAMQLAFQKARANDRKRWIVEAIAKPAPEPVGERVTLSEMVDTELVNYSIANVRRSIPSAIDGLKPSTRKIVHVSIKRNVREEFKVAQLAAAVAEGSAYHHGEESLSGAIINLAQTFVGSNNLNLLEPVGMFGTRLANGKDSAAPRYLFTHLTKAALCAFHPADAPLLTYLEENGKAIEPAYFVPTVPLILLNGASGIGTGFSTYVPNHALEDVIANIRAMLQGLDPVEMHPSWAGFKGTVRATEKGEYVVSGVYERIDSSRIRITELPVGTSIDAYKAFLESDKLGARSIKNDCTDAVVDFTVEFSTGRLEAILPDIERELCLTRKLSTNNMHLFDSNGHIRRFETVTDILREFFGVRLSLYERRLLHLIRQKEEELAACSYRALFVTSVLDGGVRLLKAKVADVRADMSAAGIPETYHQRFMSLPLSSLTADEVERLLAAKEALVSALDLLKGKTAPALWEEDLLELERARKIGA
ncbi:DNA topoisomerase 2 [Klebsormidium nitens]|uniref:DNA topoisomerase 2 n=1 Tax=Klebsormidium nitens TaxID=105231 RepID=A0A1Y1IJN2_KLENI|nr:DNA topoisomerase 2 [Klebsormidium nitens]|eukprot:GAQ91105.1 DNA topoisomerase 2 [Klebsormidium nitens]